MIEILLKIAEKKSKQIYLLIVEESVKSMWFLKLVWSRFYALITYAYKKLVNIRN